MIKKLVQSQPKFILLRKVIEIDMYPLSDLTHWESMRIQ